MPKKIENKKLSLDLLRESIWGIEDKLKVIMETFADQEAEMIRIKNKVNKIEYRIKNGNK